MLSLNLQIIIVSEFKNQFQNIFNSSVFIDHSNTLSTIIIHTQITQETKNLGLL